VTLTSSSRNTLNRQSLGLGLVALLLFIAGVYQQAAIGFDSRFVLFAEEMLRHGPTPSLPGCQAPWPRPGSWC